MMHNGIATALVGAIRNGDDGGTFPHPSLNADATARYIVGGACESLTLNGREAQKELPKRLHDWSVNHPAGYSYGFWWDTHTNLLWVDAVNMTDDLGMALKIARDRNEIAIFDTVTNEEIRVTY